MQIDLTLRGMLRDYLPPGEGRGTRRVEVVEAATVDAVLRQLRIPVELVHLVLVNGVRVPRAELDTRSLNRDDALAVWPPLSGG